MKTELDAQFLEYLRSDRDNLLQQIEAAKKKIMVLDALLGSEAEAQTGYEFGPVKVITDPRERFRGLRRSIFAGPPTTMGLCREALSCFGQEATAREIKDLIRNEFKEIPAKSITEMLYKRGSKQQSGIYRVVSEHGPAKYGLLVWKKSDVRGSDGGFVAPDDEEIPTEPQGGKT